MAEKISPKIRKKIFEKYGGRCAYCGKRLKAMHVDHIEPVRRDENKKPLLPERHNEDNLNPSCPRCNFYKGVFTVEMFREELSRQVDRARKTSLNFRLAEDFKLIRIRKKPVVFYFEQFNNPPAVEE